MRKLLLLLAALVLAACASTNRPPASLQRLAGSGDFDAELRFALRLHSPSGTGQSLSGRISWQRSGDRDTLLISGPLGQGLAEIELGPADHVLLRTGAGDVRRGAEAVALLRDLLGGDLPLSQLGDWLAGRDERAITARDPQGRAARREAMGWTVDYDYADERRDALPARLTLNRAGEIELRLRIEDWQASPR